MPPWQGSAAAPPPDMSPLEWSRFFKPIPEEELEQMDKEYEQWLQSQEAAKDLPPVGMSDEEADALMKDSWVRLRVLRYAENSLYSWSSEPVPLGKVMAREDEFPSCKAEGSKLYKCGWASRGLYRPEW